MISSTQAEQLLDGVDVLDSGTGPVVALAHGAGGGVRENFAPLIDSPTTRHRLVGPYYPGAGATPLATHPLSIETLADQVVASGVRAGADRFPVAGVSLGGAVAVTAAARHPEHVSALAVTVPLLRPDAQVRAVASVWRTLADNGDYDTLARFVLLVGSSADTLAQLSGAEARAVVEQIRAGYPAGGASQIELATRVDVSSLLHTVTVPTFVVVAGADGLLLPETVRGYRAIAGAEVVEYPDAGHVFTPAEADRWTIDIGTFLERT